jgi:multimeric flavodoxin WrbA
MSARVSAPREQGRPSTIALFASGRRHGNTGRLIDSIAGIAGIEVVDLADLSIAPYDYEHGNRADDFEPLMKRLLDYDQIIFATPVYWYAAAAPMKLFLDRISDLLDLPDLKPWRQRLRGKRAFVVCTSVYDTVPAPFENAFRETFAYLGMRYGGLAHVNCRRGYDSAAAGPEVAGMLEKIGASGRDIPVNSGR